MIVKATSADVAALENQQQLITTMANLGSLQISQNTQKPAGASAFITENLEVYIELEGLVDFEAERVRLTKLQDKLMKDKERYDKKLANQGFLSKAAPEIVEKTRADAADVDTQLERVQAQLAELA